MTAATHAQLLQRPIDADQRMTVLGVSYDNIRQQEAIERALSFVSSDIAGQVFFVNADCIYQANQRPEYRQMLADAPLVLPDGIGLSMATRLLGGRMVDNCNGTDLSPLLIEAAAERGHSVYLLGGLPGVAEQAARNLRDRFPALNIAGSDHGFHDNNDDVIQRINESQADILFVAFGVPLQEEWICTHRDHLTPRLCLGVGALLDFLSGRVRRAPRILRALRLEWIWRFLMEPRRLFRRYFIDGSRFSASVAAEALGRRSV